MRASDRLSISDALDRLYAAPLDRFVALRRDLAAELRALGEVARSREVSAAKKPSRTVWALNQVARRHPQRLQAVFEAHAAGARAQSRGDAESMRETARVFRDLVADVVRASADILAEVGAGMSATQARQVAEMMRAAIVGDPEPRARLLAGRLAEDIEVDEPFAGLEEAPRGGRPPSRPSLSDESEKRSAAAREREEQRVREARARDLEEARVRVEALEVEARQARVAARQAETAATQAQAEADRARRAVAVIEERLEGARRGLTKA